MTDKNKNNNAFEDLLSELSGIDQMMSDFLAAETEGLIVCESCYDTAFDDDENLAYYTDEDVMQHVCCCPECREDWLAGKTGHDS